MAYLCVKNPSMECGACGACSPDPEVVGECAACGDLIYAHEERYDIEGELIHADCLTDWAKKYEVII